MNQTTDIIVIVHRCKLPLLHLRHRRTRVESHQTIQTHDSNAVQVLFNREAHGSFRSCCISHSVRLNRFYWT